MKRVLVVGGGYAGVTLAKALDATFDVVLVERRDRFYHNVGAMRAYADPPLFERLLIPYERLLPRGRVVQAEVVQVETGAVRTAAGEVIEADAIVVATGSRHVMPFKSDFVHSADFTMEAKRLAEQLKAAERVVILGDGPVAVELAGEVSWRFPKKNLQLVAAGNRLIPRAGNPRLGAKLLHVLQARGVEVLFGERGVTGAGLVIPGFGSETSVPCLGSAVRVKVNSKFQVSGIDGVFAIGDAADCGEPQLTFLARRQAEHLARYFANPNIAGYRPVTRVAMSIPLGPDSGFTQLPLPGLPVAGAWLTSRLKGRKLFVEKNWALLNALSP